MIRAFLGVVRISENVVDFVGAETHGYSVSELNEHAKWQTMLSVKSKEGARRRHRRNGSFWNGPSASRTESSGLDSSSR